MANEKRLIDANALVPYLWALFKFFGSIPCTEADKATQRGIKRCIGEIKKMPTVDAVEVVHGRWEPHPRHPGFYRCSVCHDCNIADDWAGSKWKFCPECGAKMDGGME